jgi:hypothetical protein
MSQKFDDHAAVLRATMGGLLAARVLADACRRVTILERDLLPESAQDRKGVPQGRHARALLRRGAQILDELFPGLLADLVADASLVLHAPREFPDSVPKPLLRGSAERCVPVSGHAMALGIPGEDDDIGGLPCGPSPADLATRRVFGSGQRSVAGGAAWGS